MIFFDTHAHLDFPEFSGDQAEVVARAEAAGIQRIISIGTDLASSSRAIQAAERFANVFAAVGWHPNHALEAPDDVRASLRELAKHPKVVAIGETGFDYSRLPSRDGKGTPADDERVKQKQAQVFRQQLEVAAELGLNCVIHQRESFEDALAEMEKWAGRLRGVFHCFVGTANEMQRVLATGGLVSFTGILTFKNAPVVRETLAATPLDRFMLETDCPFLAPVPHRGKRCEPAYVKEIAEMAAQVKNCTLDQLSAATCATARQFFPKLK